MFQLFLPFTSQGWTVGRHTSSELSRAYIWGIETTSGAVLGPVTVGGVADVDFLASKFNNKLDTFVFRYRGPLCVAVALVAPWDQYNHFSSETPSSILL